MKVAIIGGGPGGLYFSILLKKTVPAADITVYERNRPDDTFGWGVVFSDETLAHFELADRPSYTRIQARFRGWSDIETWTGGVRTVSRGHGFCGVFRRDLLSILHHRCRELGVALEFQEEATTLDAFVGADLVVAADGVNSRVRDLLSAEFRPRLDWRRCKFCWLGTTLPLQAFTFIFKTSPHGLFQVHAYPFEDGLSTWIVECREDVWRRAGLDRAGEPETVAFCEALFAEHLQGHRLLTNKSMWRTFPTVTCERWHHQHVVLLGDAAHTAHFSIGSGTKLAMEDAIALAEEFRTRGTANVPAVLAAYEAARRPEVARLQRVAQTSLEWFENSARYVDQPPLQFTFNLMTRNRRITYDALRLRDPRLVDAASEWFRQSSGAPLDSHGQAPPPAFTPFRLRGLTLPNRIVVSPMCQYSAVDGSPTDWHLVHLGSRAVGGAGLVIAEATGVSPEGRISLGCTGLYRPEHGAAWKRIVDFVHRHSRSAIGIQIGHAGRKGSAHLPWEKPDTPLGAGGWPTLAPSALPFAPSWPTPKAMDRKDLDLVRDQFVRAAELADQAGFDVLELHMAHGYLLSSFISPLTNHRTDAYGGPLEHRLRFPGEVCRAVREAWPAAKPLAVRISACDWVADGGITGDDAVAVARALKDAGADIIDVSTGGLVPDARPDYGRMYQVPFADQIRHEASVPVMAVGAIQDADQANTILLAGRADLCLMARAHLSDPYLTLHAAAAYGFPDAPWPNQYLAARPAPPR